MRSKIPMYIAVELKSNDDWPERRVWLPLPVTKTKFEVTLLSIGAYSDGRFIISDYNVRVPGMIPDELMRSPLNKVNYFASRLEALSDHQVELLAAISDARQYFTSIDQYIQFTFDSSGFMFSPGVFCEKDLGLLRQQDPLFGALHPDIKDCVDPKSLGRSVAIVEGGIFAGRGYIASTDRFRMKRWEGIVPDELNLKGPLLGEDLYGDWSVGVFVW